MMERQLFSTNVMAWYHQNKRDLPFRGTSDPYRIWLSEIILQQTRIQQGMPYYERFIKAFPTVQQLARARVEQVLRLWQGLGYYTRARNLHACARKIVREYGGTFPNTYEDLIQLPGIGPYTAAAIASMAFGQSIAAVDGNVTRVLSRYFAIDKPVNTPEGKKIIQELSQSLIDPLHPGEYNQAVMELGAIICVPKNPDCPTCPVQHNCLARSLKKQHKLPVKAARSAVRSRYFYYLVFRQGNKMYFRKRNHKDIWQGMYDFYCLEYDRKQSSQVLTEYIRKNFHGRVIRMSDAYVHQLTHQKIIAHFIEISSSMKHLVGMNLRACTPGQADRLPKPALIARFLTDSGFFID
jgi:A/G-specific adenine glycosylase